MKILETIPLIPREPRWFGWLRVITKLALAAGVEDALVFAPKQIAPHGASSVRGFLFLITKENPLKITIYTSRYQSAVFITPQIAKQRMLFPAETHAFCAYPEGPAKGVHVAERISILIIIKL
jgi:hypothetical protein